MTKKNEKFSSDQAFAQTKIEKRQNRANPLLTVLTVRFFKIIFKIYSKASLKPQKELNEWQKK
jgi:hypothetical protein